jgi:hypothetical protein
MWFSSWLRKWKRSAPRAGAHRFPRQRSTFRPQLEALEDRLAPATLTVNSVADTTAAGNSLNLREAVLLVNAGGNATAALGRALTAGEAGQVDQTQPFGSNDTILFDPSLAGQTISLFSGQLVINKSLTIQGLAAPQAPVAISSGGTGVQQFSSRLFEIDGAGTNVALSNLNLTNGVGVAGGVAGTGALDGQGGAIWNDGILTLTACNLDNNSCVGGSPEQGGAIWNDGILTLNACNLDYNSCYGGGVALGGAIYNAGTLTVNNSELGSNSAGNNPSSDPPGPSPGDGGAIYNAGTLTINNSDLDGNYAYYNYNNPLLSGGLGGGIFNASNASATVTGSKIRSNNAGNEGGGIYNDGTMTLIDSTVTNNYNPHGENDLYNLGTVKLKGGSIVGGHGH